MSLLGVPDGNDRLMTAVAARRSCLVYWGWKRWLAGVFCWSVLGGDASSVTITPTAAIYFIEDLAMFTSLERWESFLPHLRRWSASLLSSTIHASQ